MSRFYGKQPAPLPRRGVPGGYCDRWDVDDHAELRDVIEMADRERQAMIAEIRAVSVRERALEASRLRKSRRAAARSTSK